MNDVKKLIAKELLQINAIKLNPAKAFFTILRVWER